MSFAFLPLALIDISVRPYPSGRCVSAKERKRKWKKRTETEQVKMKRRKNKSGE